MGNILSGLEETYSAITSGSSGTSDFDWESTNSGDPTTYYEQGYLRTIVDGMNGLEVANVIYDNDTMLRLEIQKLESELEAYKAYVAELESGGVDVGIEQQVGSGTTDVMSQAAVTNVVDVLQKQIDDSVFAMRCVPPEAIPLDNVKTADYAIQAAQDLEGHDLVQMWYDIRDLEHRVSAVTENLTELVEWKNKIFKG